MANRIKQARKELGLSQKQIGEELGVAQTTVSAWESGRNEPDYESLRKMAEILQCSIEYLMGYEVDMHFRGLSQEKWLEIRLREQEIAKEKRHEDLINQLENEEIEEYFEEEERRELMKEWEKTGKNIYKESVEIDRIFENRNIDEEDRKRAVEVIKLMFPHR